VFAMKARGREKWVITIEEDRKR